MAEKLSKITKIESKENDKIVKIKPKRRNYWLTGSFDIGYFICTFLLLSIGLLMLYSASYPYAYQNEKGDSSYFLKHALFFAVAGFIGMIIISHIDIRFYRKKIMLVLIIGGTLGSLILVLKYHTNVGDFKRWIPLFGGFTFQPSDIAKFTLVFLLALHFYIHRKDMNKPIYNFFIPCCVIGLFCFLVYKEHHLSCTILLAMIGFVLMYCAGADWRLMAAAAGLVLAVAIYVVLNPDILDEYQAERIIAWLDKSYEPLKSRWQTNNSLYAIGSGGLFGVGIGNSTQKYLYVSEPQNDFIFAIVCEELGFVRVTGILAIFATLFVLGIRIALKTKDLFSRYVVIGIVLQVALQTIFNILVVTDLFPNTGIAFPFFSYGGTAMLALLGEMGIVLAVSRKNNMLIEDEDEEE